MAIKSHQIQLAGLTERSARLTTRHALLALGHHPSRLPVLPRPPGSMAKKRKQPAKAAVAKKEAAPNLFERLSNQKRFNVLGRKVKGETRNTSRLRTAAAEKVGAPGGPGDAPHATGMSPVAADGC